MRVECKSSANQGPCASSIVFASDCVRPSDAPGARSANKCCVRLATPAGRAGLPFARLVQAEQPADKTPRARRAAHERKSSMFGRPCTPLGPGCLLLFRRRPSFGSFYFIYFSCVALDVDAVVILGSGRTTAGWRLFLLDSAAAWPAIGCRMRRKSAHGFRRPATQMSRSLGN